jgi:hypothetical protein
MRRKIVLLALAALLVLLAPACKTSSGGKMISEKEVASDEFGNVWVARLYEEDCDKDRHPSDEATLNIRNNLDRNITLDFDGPDHHEISIGDKRTATLRLEHGSYGILLNAPGLKYAPGNFSYSLEGHCVYEMTWERIASRTQYRE